MSRVTNYILTGPCLCMDPFVAKLNEELREEHSMCFVGVSDHAGGRKAMELDVYLSAMNYFTPDRMKEVIVKVWDELRKRLSQQMDREQLQVFVHGTEDYRVTELQLWE